MDIIYLLEVCNSKGCGFNETFRNKHDSEIAISAIQEVNIALEKDGKDDLTFHGTVKSYIPVQGSIENI